MTRVRMSLPDCWRRQIAVDGHAVRLEPLQHELVTLLLLSPPDRVVSYDELVEWLWPNAELQPLDALGIIGVSVCRLRQAGVAIENEWGCGFSVPASARGGPPPPRLHTLDQRGAARRRFRRFAA